MWDLQGNGRTSRRENGRLRGGQVPGQPCDRTGAARGCAATPVVDQPFQRLAEGVEEHFIDPFDQLAVAVQFHRVEVEAALVQHGDATLELRRSHREADGRWRRDDVGAADRPGEVPRAGIHQQVGDAPETVGRGQLLHLLDQFLQLGAAGLGDRQLRRCGTEHEPLHRVRLGRRR